VNKTVQGVEAATKPYGSGIRFERIGKNVRSAYTQRDGTTILADACRCRVIWSIRTFTQQVPMSVARNPSCPVDEHAHEARNNTQNN
jgi:hypothetical protein